MLTFRVRVTSKEYSRSGLVVALGGRTGAGRGWDAAKPILPRPWATSAR
jgi:hypothetical protein